MSSQLRLDGITFCNNNIVNVATVKLRSPFRYPGGKTWLVPRIITWMNSKKDKPDFFIEPFTGGGIVGLTVAFEKLANKVILVELDEDVASVWKTIISDDYKWLTQRIRNYNLTLENVVNEFNNEPSDIRERAFQTILKNRVNRGGILASNAGMMKFGENNKGISSRWYPATLIKRINDIHSIKERILFFHDDGLAIIREYANSRNHTFFIDPPYTAPGKAAGKRLYTHWELDHDGLFKACSEVEGDFLLTYENTDSIRKLATKYDFQQSPISMKSSHHEKMTELLIGKDLSWINL